MSSNAPATAARPAATRPAAPAAPIKPPSRLHLAKRGVIHEPFRYFFYGPPGVGKSSLAADAPDPIWLDANKASARLDVRRYHFRDGEDGYLMESLAECHAAVEDLIANDHSHRTLVLDTAGDIEALLWRHVCETAPTDKGGSRPKTIEDFGYGKGYVAAVDEWRRLLHRLDVLRLKRGMDVIVIDHSVVTPFKNPLGDDYDRYQPKIDRRAAASLISWADVVGYICFEEGGAKATTRDRARGWSTGQRLIRLERTAAWDAKRRIGMPETIELLLESPWKPFADAIEASRSVTIESVTALIEAELARLGAEFVKEDGGASSAAAVRRAVAATDSTTTLGKYLTGLKASQPKTQEQE